MNQQEDSLSTMMMSTQREILEGPSTVAERDQTLPQFRKATPPPPATAYYREWPSAESKKPKSYTGASFKYLVEAGKIVNPAQKQQPRDMDMLKEKKHAMPGYTGYIRGKQHVSGRTYGETTRRAFDTDYGEHVTTSPIPSNPNANRRIKHDKLEDSFIYNTFGEKKYHIPGYTGHVPMTRGMYSETYGATTRKMIDQFQKNYPRQEPQERPGYAYTTRARQMLHIDSTPVPGGLASHAPPKKLIPSKCNRLRFYVD